MSRLARGASPRAVRPRDPRGAAAGRHVATQPGRPAPGSRTGSRGTSARGGRAGVQRSSPGSVAACPVVARGRGIRQLGALPVVIAVVLAAGCGGGQTFTASEFVDRINAQGVSIELGRRLHSGGGADEIYAVRLPPLPGEPPPPPGSEGGRGASGSLYVFGDTGGASDQFDACGNSGGLLCFQASNIVVVLEDGGLEAQRLAVAMRRLASR